MLGAIGFLSPAHEDGTASLGIVRAQVSSTEVVFILYLHRPGSLLRRTDAAALLLVGAGLLLCDFTDSAVHALAISILIGLLGSAQTMATVFRDPGGRIMVTWLISTIASICASLAVGEVDWMSLARPICKFVPNTGIFVAMLPGRFSRSPRALTSGTGRLAA